MTNNSLVFERSRTAREAHVVSTNIKSILLHVQNDANVRQRFQLALSLARATGSHIECVHVTPIEAYLTTGTLGGLYALDKAIKRIDTAEEQLRAELEQHLEAEDVTWDYEYVAAYPAPELVRRAALADLVITGREAHLARVQRAELAVLGDILTHIRTPLLIAGTDVQAVDPMGTAVVAWNGSFEAANAVRFATGLLKLASEVRIVRYEEAKDAAFPDTRLTQYLSRHGIRAELELRTVARGFADDLVEYASAYGASYIVMGAYSHNRAGEFLFGGVTRELLRSCPTSLVMAH